MGFVSNHGYSLYVEPYCASCMSFEPKHEILNFSDLKTARIEHYIFCENRLKCQQIHDHIKRTLSEIIAEKRAENNAES